ALVLGLGAPGRSGGTRRRLSRLGGLGADDPPALGLLASLRLLAAVRPLAWLLPTPRRRRAALSHLAHRHLAVGADRPARGERLRARRARILQPRAALRAAQVAALDRVLAVRARLLGQLAHAKLRRPHLELAFLGVVEVLGRPQDRVDERADEREERRQRRA